LQAIPPGCSRYSISIKKPLGIVLEENKDSGVITVVSWGLRRVGPEGASSYFTKGLGTKDKDNGSCTINRVSGGSDTFTLSGWLLSSEMISV
jgi:hypothetical protein